MIRETYKAIEGVNGKKWQPFLMIFCVLGTYGFALFVFFYKETVTYFKFKD